MNVAQWQHIETLDKDADFKLNRLSYLSEKSIDKLESMPLIELKMLFEYYAEPKYRVNKCFRLGFKLFKPIHSMSEFTIAQETDLNGFVKQSNGNYTLLVEQLLALTHKELTITGFKYVQANHAKNSELFKKSKAKKVLGNLFFYSKLSKSLNKNINTCSKLLENHAMEMERDTAFQAFLKTSERNTV